MKHPILLSIFNHARLDVESRDSYINLN